MIFNKKSADIRRREKRNNKILQTERARDKYSIPHDWFAWYPVRVSETKVAWLTTVIRSGVFSPSFDRYWNYQGQHLKYWRYQIKSD